MVKSSHPLWYTWVDMVRRCNNPKRPGYSRYGGRGISVCPRWKDFWVFVEDVGTRPSKKHSLDRIDNDGNYEPDNTRWATAKQQNLNRRNNRYIELFGESLTVGAWAARYHVPRGTLLSRLNKGWSPERAILTPKLVPVKKYVPGARYGAWTLVERAEQDTRGRRKGGSLSLWIVRCDCGTEVVRRLTRLVNGRSKSCGCGRYPKPMR